ncbi:bifunctional serine/threonine-protein kinase/formylglycine-generating enzyme family protein [Haliangium ochraceum]|uniref:Serine/threonine protein kinase n=1 Tax=Haliangium ochraceum (strain DSM 14365 / JCM 11303 / SMP-2) TaxID=502025 RepID=D0LMH0_HALO1|nr:bifunctional serine/threonine-protein kinase/formylglycine-generating enzyme family protein [Haliangium ochraceum]ACY18657.1 serine/threonine protein kinase [Haliangium ochraceum DSM 14365]
MATAYDPDEVFAPAETFDEYQLLGRLGEGGMGRVYLARDTLLQRLVAIKFMHRYRDAIARERFLVEARAAARLQHPNTVAVYRVGELDGQPYIVSEYVRGDSLAALDVPLPWSEVLHIGRELARGLAAAHVRGILHRDIKPANAIRADSGEIKLLDFGLAKLLDAGEIDDAAGARLAPRARSPEIVLAEDAQPSVSLPETTLPPDADTVEISDSRTPSADTCAGPLTRLGAEVRAGPGEPASALTRPGARMGTPLYMPPELWRGEPASTASDVFSLGALLWYLGTGQPLGLEGRAGSRAAERDPGAAPSVAARSPSIDPGFAAILERCLAHDPRQRFASAVPLWDALESLGDDCARAALPDGNPYRGLQPFDAEHRGLFFGRGVDIRTVLERLRAQPLLLVTGQSGVGKSSLCRAGVLPMVEAGAFRDHRRWTTATLQPGRTPHSALRTALAQAMGAEPAALEPAASAARLAEAVSVWLGRERGLLVFIDQLEELVTLSEPAPVSEFCEQLAALTALGATTGVRVLATVRGDYLTRLAELPVLGPEIEGGFQLLRPLGASAIRETIVGPARALGADFEPEALVDALVDAGLDGGLPLLQFALAELWDARDRERARLTAAALAERGGVAGALERHADEVIAGLAAPARALAWALLLRMVTPARTRGSRRRDELITGEDTRIALEALVRGRLVVARDDESGQPVYEIAHEALLTHWSALAHCLDTADASRALRGRLTAAVIEWHEIGRPSDALWRGQRLEQAAALDPALLAPLESEFVRTSERTARRQRWSRRAALALVPALVALVYVGMRSEQQRTLDQRTSAYHAKGREALERAQALHPIIADRSQRAFARFDTGDAEHGEALWQRVIDARERQESLHRSAMLALERAFALDPERALSRQLMARLLSERARAAERAHRYGEAREQLERMAVYDDGTLAAAWNRDATLSLALEPADATCTITRQRERASDAWLVRAPAAPPAFISEECPRRHPRSLPAGSYAISLHAPGRLPLHHLVALGRGEQLQVELRLPRSDEVPEGFVYVPAGRFWYGSAASEAIRRWQSAAPVHRRHTGAYLIARHETTYQQWLEFLDTMTEKQRSRFVPRVSSGYFGTMALDALGDGWQLTLQPTEHAYVVRDGQRLRYLDRADDSGRTVQDWMRMPVSGVSWLQAQAYLAWLSRTGQVPHARMCREDEWERAARGVDLRSFPHGDDLAPSDANFDETYGRKARAFGPDEVGSFPRSRSPFGIDDMVGNVLELTASAQGEDEIILRGGAYYFDRASSHVANRNVFQKADSMPTVGFRVCADVATPSQLR